MKHRPYLATSNGARTTTQGDKEVTEPVGVSLRVTVNPETLWEAAIKAYTHGDESRLEDAVAFLGTKEAPRLGACMAEMVAENDHEGLFDNYAWDGDETN